MSGFRASLERALVTDALSAAEDAALDREMAYTPWSASCRNLYDPARCCRRRLGHKGDCACGYGRHRVRWCDPTRHPKGTP